MQSKWYPHLEETLCHIGLYSHAGVSILDALPAVFHCQKFLKFSIPSNFFEGLDGASLVFAQVLLWCITYRL